MRLASLVIFAAAIGTVHSMASRATNREESKHMDLFRAALNAPWQEIFYDSCTNDWQENWRLDGQRATVTNAADGMTFIAGPTIRDDSHHAVLWTKRSFEGDPRIDYEYTRVDKETRAVNIIYIQATGSGEPGFEEDISLWQEKRRIPAMRTYYDNMNLATKVTAPC